MPIPVPDQIEIVIDVSCARFVGSVYEVRDLVIILKSEYKFGRKINREGLVRLS
jgi:hypothetical protein